MNSKNLANLDRALRVVIGAGLLLWYFLGQGEGLLHTAKLFGLVLLASGLLGTCPIYMMFGFSTNRSN